MRRFLTTLALLLAAAHAHAEVIVASYDFTTATDRARFTASAPSNGSWFEDNDNGFVLGQTAQNITGTATLTQNNAFQFGQTGTASVFVTHFWAFGVNDGARLAYSNDGSTWNYALAADFTTQGYNTTSTQFAGDANQVWGGTVGGASPAQVVSRYQFNVTNPSLDYFFRFEAKLAGANDYDSNDIWGVKAMTVAVPEPGTLLLGGIAAASGGAGAWWKRRRKKQDGNREHKQDPDTSTV